MPLLWRTSWWLADRERPLTANVKYTCVRGDEWPLFSLSKMKVFIFSSLIFPESMSAQICCGVNLE